MDKKEFLKGGLFDKDFMQTKVTTNLLSKKEKIFGYALGPGFVMVYVSMVTALREMFYMSARPIDALFGAGTYMGIQTASSIVGIVFGLLLGYITERTVCRAGRIRPYVLIGTLLMAFTGVGMFCSPFADGTIAQLVWLYMINILYIGIATTMFNLRIKMISLSTRNIKERNFITTMRSAIDSMIPGIFVALLVQGWLYYVFLMNDMTGDIWRLFVAIPAVVAVGATLLEYFYTRERITESNQAVVENKDDSKLSTMQQLKGLLTNKYYLMSILIGIGGLFFTYLQGVNSRTYFCQYILGANEQNGIAMLYLIIAMQPMAIGAVLIPNLAKRIGARKIMLVSSIVVLAGVAVCLIDPTNFGMACGGGLLFSFGIFAVTNMYGIFEQQAGDDIEYRYGFRPEGTVAANIIFAVYTALMSPLSALYETVLYNRGFEPYVAVQNEAVNNWILFAYYGGYAIMAIIVLVVCIFFDYEKKEKEIRRVLDERAKAACEARGEEWVDSEEEERLELEAKKQAKLAKKNLRKKKRKKFLKRLVCVILVLVVVFAGYRGFSAFMDQKSGTYTFTIDASEKGKKLWNPVSTVNFWDIQKGTWIEPVKNEESDIFQFVEYVEFMQCTGGSETRDLFVDPLDTTVLDDYDFSTLIESCRGVVDLGGKPLLKLGSVPLKYTTDAKLSGSFGTNVYPPDDYDVYYQYIAAIAQALVDEFGMEEVQSWRFGVMTEFQNAEWFQAKDGEAESSAIAYMKLYDYTVAALESVLGDEIFVGAHSLGQSDGLWDDEMFVRHCATEENYCTGEIGTRLCYLSGSFYDVRPGMYAPLSRNLPDTIAHLREIAQKYDMDNLIYGIDEGGLLMGNQGGSNSTSLVSRSVGDTYQAGYDARLIKQMFDNDINYVSKWSYLSEGLLEGNPSVSYHVASLAAKFDGAFLVDTDKTKSSFGPGTEVEAMAAYNEETETLYVMAYNFRNSVNYTGEAELNFNLNIPQFDGKNVSVKSYVIDDDSNYFDEWLNDREKYNITSDMFSWSPEDHEIGSDGALRDEKALELYWTELYDKYTEYSKLIPTETTENMEGGSLQLNITLQPYAVVFYEITVE